MAPQDKQPREGRQAAKMLVLGTGMGSVFLVLLIFWLPVAPKGDDAGKPVLYGPDNSVIGRDTQSR
jgi:hypothetical protein